MTTFPPTEPLVAPTRPTNPKEAVGVLKPPLSYVSQAVLAEVGLGMLEGGYKYGRHNYRAVGVRASIYFDATWRHIAAWWEGEDYDPDSKARLSHITKAICSLVVLRDAMIQDRCEDDRPPKSNINWQNLAEIVRQINEQYPDPKPYITEKGQMAGIR